jgi:hypothetical protein
VCFHPIKLIHFFEYFVFITYQYFILILIGRQRKYEMIIRENTPQELPPDVVRCKLFSTNCFASFLFYILLLLTIYYAFTIYFKRHKFFSYNYKTFNQLNFFSHLIYAYNKPSK